MVSRVGDSLYNIGITWFILDLTGAGTIMSLYLATGMTTYILMGPLAGVLVDRWNRVRILFVTDLIRGVLISLAGALYFLGADPSVFLVILFLITIATNLCSALFNPAATALMPNIVSSSQLTRANSLQSMVDSGSAITGLILGGIIYTLIGIQGIFIINAFSFLLSGLSEIFIRIPFKKKEDGGERRESGSSVMAILIELKEGFVYIRKERWLFVITVFAFLINFFINPMMTIYIPYIVNQVLQVEPVYLSYIQASTGVGILLGSLAMSRQTQQERIGFKLLRSFSVMMIPLFSVAFVFNYFILSQMDVLTVILIFVGSFFVMGTMMAFVNIPINVLMQKRVPNMLLGRVDAVFSTLLMTGIPIGMIMGGILTDWLPMSWILYATTIALSAIALVGWLKRSALDF